MNLIFTKMRLSDIDIPQILFFSIWWIYLENLNKIKCQFIKESTNSRQMYITFMIMQNISIKSSILQLFKWLKFKFQLWMDSLLFTIKTIGEMLILIELLPLIMPPLALMNLIAYTFLMGIKIKIKNTNLN